MWKEVPHPRFVPVNHHNDTLPTSYHTLDSIAET
jgi:hypothetical protein